MVGPRHYDVCVWDLRLVYREGPLGDAAVIDVAALLLNEDGVDFGLGSRVTAYRTGAPFGML